MTVYIDQKTIRSYGGLVEPTRLYLYDMETQTPLIDYFVDNTTGQKEFDKKINHDGLIQYDSDKEGLKYKSEFPSILKILLEMIQSLIS